MSVGIPAERRPVGFIQPTGSQTKRGNMTKINYRAVAFFLLGLIVGCAGDNLIETLLSRMM